MFSSSSKELIYSSIIMDGVFGPSQKLSSSSSSCAKLMAKEAETGAGGCTFRIYPEATWEKDTVDALRENARIAQLLDILLPEYTKQKDLLVHLMLISETNSEEYAYHYIMGNPGKKRERFEAFVALIDRELATPDNLTLIHSLPDSCAIDISTAYQEKRLTQGTLNGIMHRHQTKSIAAALPQMPVEIGRIMSLFALPNQKASQVNTMLPIPSYPIEAVEPSESTSLSSTLSKRS